jgi:hypothetical protein
MVGHLPIADYYLRSGKGFNERMIEKIAFSRQDSDVHVVNKSIHKLGDSLDISVIDKQDIVCNNSANVCELFVSGGKKAFYDGDHYSLSGARVFGNRLIRALIREGLVPGQVSD